MLLLSFLLAYILCEGQNTSVKIRPYNEDKIFLALDGNEIAMADEKNAKGTFIVSISSNSTEDKPMYRIKSLTSSGYMLGRDDTGKLVSTTDQNTANVDWEIILDPTKTFEIIRSGETCLTFHSDSFHLEQCGGDYANPPVTQRFAVLTGEQNKNQPESYEISTTPQGELETKTIPPKDIESIISAPPVHTLSESTTKKPENNFESSTTSSSNEKQNEQQTSTGNVKVDTVSQPGGKTEELVTNEIKKNVVTASTTNVTQTSTETSLTQVITTTLTKLIESKTQITQTITDTYNVTETCTATQYKTEVVQIPIAAYPTPDSDQGVKEKITCDDGTDKIVEKETNKPDHKKSSKYKKHHSGKPKKKTCLQKLSTISQNL